MKQHTVHRLPDGAFAGGGRPLRPIQTPPPEPPGRRLLGQEDLPPPRFRIPLTSTPVPAEAPAGESGS